MSLVIARLPITHHSHDKRKRSTRTVILVGIEEDAKSLEVVGRAEHGTLCCALLGEPEREAITVKVALPVDFEFEFDLLLIRYFASYVHCGIGR